MQYEYGAVLLCKYSVHINDTELNYPSTPVHVYDMELNKDSVPLSRGMKRMTTLLTYYIVQEYDVKLKLLQWNYSVPLYYGV